MADGHANKSSAQKANSSELLAESLLNLVESCSENAIEPLAENYGEVQKYIEELRSEISRSSTAEVQAKLCKDTTGKLYSKRDDMIAFCKYKYSNFPKDKPLRRITRTGGKSANEKLASDLIALVKYCCSGEMTVEIHDMFKKSSVTQDTSFISSQSQKTTSCSDMDQFSSLAENLDSKLCLLKEDFEQTVKSLRDEISELKSDVCVKQAKIVALESELATFKGNCKSNLEKLDGKFESFKIEVSKHGENIAKYEKNLHKLSKEFEKLRKETKEIVNGPLTAENQLASTTETVSPESDYNTYAVAVKSDANLNLNDLSGASQSDSENKRLRNGSQNLKPSGESCGENEQNNPIEIQSDSSDVNGVGEESFVGVERKRIKRLYLGGVREGATEKLISDYMNRKGITPTFVRLMKSKRKGTIAVRVNVLNDDFELASMKEFWPMHVYAREWLSKERWLQKSGSDIQKNGES